MDGIPGASGRGIKSMVCQQEPSLGLGLESNPDPASVILDK